MHWLGSNQINHFPLIPFCQFNSCSPSRNHAGQLAQHSSIWDVQSHDSLLNCPKKTCSIDLSRDSMGCEKPWLSWYVLIRGNIHDPFISVILGCVARRLIGHHLLRVQNFQRVSEDRKSGQQRRRKLRRDQMHSIKVVETAYITLNFHTEVRTCFILDFLFSICVNMA